MLAFQAGDEAAFRELVHRNQARVYGVIRRFLGSAAAVEDLTQEVFLRVFRSAARYDPTAKFSTWLYRVTANLCLNTIRSRRRSRIAWFGRSSDDGDAIAREVEDVSAPLPAAAADRRETAQIVQAAVNALPANQRLAIILNKYEQMSYANVAEVLDCSTMAVKSLLSRARSNLRRVLSPRLLR